MLDKAIRDEKLVNGREEMRKFATLFEKFLDDNTDPEHGVLLARILAQLDQMTASINEEITRPERDTNKASENR